MNPNNSITEFSNQLLDVCVEYRKQLDETNNEVARLRELLERLCDSVFENWDEGIANYFREEANKPHNQ